MLNPYSRYIPFFKKTVSPSLALHIADRIVGYWSGTIRVLLWALTVDDDSKTDENTNDTTSNKAKDLPNLPMLSISYLKPI